jgi:hypothetical protein
MEKLFPPDGSAERYEHNGYMIVAEATQVERGQWLPRISVTRDGEPVPLEAPETVGPYWATREEAIRDGLERARHLLDLRDRVPLDARNPARGP